MDLTSNCYLFCPVITAIICLLDMMKLELVISHTYSLHSDFDHYKLLGLTFTQKLYSEHVKKGLVLKKVSWQNYKCESNWFDSNQI